MNFVTVLFAQCCAIVHAWRCGKFLRVVKKTVGHGNFLIWLEKNFSGSERTARNYMRLAKIYREPPNNPEITIRDAVESIVGYVAKTKKFDPNDILYYQLLRELLRLLSKDWKPREIQQFKSLISYDPRLQDILMKTMKSARVLLQEIRGEKTMPMRFEEARQRLHRQIWANYQT